MFTVKLIKATRVSIWSYERETQHFIYATHCAEHT